MTKRDYYEVLGINRGAGSDEIKSAFRNLARQYHPDINKEADSEEKFKEINEAYVILSDPDKRAAYDRFGHEGVSNGAGGMPDFSTMDFADIFEGLFGFGGMGGSRRQQNAPRRGADLAQTIELGFEEAVFGVEKEVQITRDETCTTCHGRKTEPGTNGQMTHGRYCDRNTKFFQNIFQRGGSGRMVDMITGGILTFNRDRGGIRWYNGCRHPLADHDTGTGTSGNCNRIPHNAPEITGDVSRAECSDRPLFHVNRRVSCYVSSIGG